MSQGKWPKLAWVAETLLQAIFIIFFYLLFSAMFSALGYS